MIERFGLREQALRLVQPRQTVQARGVVGCLTPRISLRIARASLVERFGLRKQTLRVVQTPPGCSGSWRNRGCLTPRTSLWIASASL